MTPDTIRRLRAALGETQQQFARRMNVGERTVVRWEHGEAVPVQYQEQRLLRLAKRHGVNEEQKQEEAL